MDAKSLKRRCQEQGLPTSGKKTDLIKRLDEHQHKKQEQTPPSDDDIVDSFASVAIPLNTPDEMIERSREELRTASMADDFEVENVEGKTVIANTRGSVIAHAAAMSSKIEGRLSRVENDLANTKNDLTNTTSQLNSKTTELDNKIQELQQVSIGYRHFRQRFLSTYKRDVLCNANDTDLSAIREGNQVVHGGNSKRDAELYSGLNQRTDIAVFKHLYGVLPTTMALIGKMLMPPGAHY